MLQGTAIAVVIPALDEERAIGLVLRDIPSFVDRVIVADNGSADGTREVARAHGAVVIVETERGYGAACLRGLEAIGAVDIVVFMDGDYSDHGSEMALLVAPILADEADMVLGSRVLGRREPGSLTPQQRLGNALATWLMRRIWGVSYTDLGPYRAIRVDALRRLGMTDRNYGWTIEMQIRAAVAGLRTREVPVSYRCRIGASKVSGTLKGTVMAGIKILSTIARFAVLAPPRSHR